MPRCRVDGVAHPGVRLCALDARRSRSEGRRASASRTPDAAGLVAGQQRQQGRHASSAAPLGRALGAALDAARDGIDLHLDEVVFCDCSALNVLLGAREEALRQGRTVVLRSVGPAVARLLTLTGTGPLFAAAPGAAPHAGAAARDVVGRTGEGAAEQGAGPHAGGTRSTGLPGGALDGNPLRRRIELVRLRRALRTHPVVDLARGVLMASFKLNAEDAWRVLALAARNTDGTVPCLARDLVAAVDGNPGPGAALPEAVTAAVAEIRS